MLVLEIIVARIMFILIVPPLNLVKKGKDRRLNAVKMHYDSL
jgi:hypothetical protein